MSAPEKLPLAVVISGRGSNMAAIAHACQQGAIARIVRVIADRRSAGGIELATQLGLDVSVVPYSGFASREAFERALAECIDESGARLVVLAGFLRILSPEFTRRYTGALLNIHPALLPKFRGLHTHERALEAQEREHGASVHFVTGELDAGPVVLQGRVPIMSGDTPETLSARVQRQEHIIYPQVIQWIAQGRLQCKDGQALFDGAPLRAPRQLS